MPRSSSQQRCPSLSLCFSLNQYSASFYFDYVYLAVCNTWMPRAAGIMTGTTPAIIGIVSHVYLKERLGASRSSASLFGDHRNAADFDACGKSTRRRLEIIFMGGILIGGSVVARPSFRCWQVIVPGNLATPHCGAVTVFGFVLTLPLAIYQAFDFRFDA